MIAPVGSLTKATADPAVMAPLDASDPFAVLFAALVPADAASPAPEPPFEWAEENAPEPAMAPLPEALLALVERMPVPEIAADTVSGSDVTLPPHAMQEAQRRDLEQPPPGAMLPVLVTLLLPALPLPSDQILLPLRAVKPEPLPSEVRALDATASDPLRPGDKAELPFASLARPISDELARAPLLPREPSSLTRSQVEVEQPIGATALPALHGLGHIASPEPAVAAGFAPAMAQQLAGQLSAALPRLRQSGGEAVLTLDPARLGRVTLSWQTGDNGGSVLTVRAVEPVTAVLLSRLGDDITAMLRTDPKNAGAGHAELRLDIGRIDRTAEPRPTDTAQGMATRELASDAGHARQHYRAPSNPDAHAQVSGRAAVNPDDPADEAAQRRSVTGGPARLA